MTRTKIQASVLAGLAVLGAVTFVVGAAALASTIGGVWAGVTVGGGAICIAATGGLYAVGVADQATESETQTQTKFR